uniref:Uncharacterized protein n=1 Tax=Ascaris lumbricoides TaxID=6252 RepID=A0A0M3I202_ASCLU
MLSRPEQIHQYETRGVCIAAFCFDCAPSAVFLFACERLVAKTKHLQVLQLSGCLVATGQDQPYPPESSCLCLGKEIT